MNLLKKILVTSLTLSSTLITVAQASTVTTAQLADNYVGADGRRISYTDYTPDNTDAYYDTHWMQVERVIDSNNNATLNVTVNSNFVAYNNSSSYSFGDLFMMDASLDQNGDSKYITADDCNDGTGRVGCNQYTEQTYTTSNTIHSEQSNNQWEYAFDLGGARSSSYSDTTVKTGNLRDLSDLTINVNDPQDAYEYSLSSTDRNRDWQAIMSNDSVVKNSLDTGTWKTLVSQDLLVMSFDITGTSLADADQIALRWAMTCANDIIEVVADLKDTVVTNVSEPTTVVLMLSALGGLFVKRRKSRA